MTNFRTLSIAVASALSLSMGIALAGEGNGEPFGVPATSGIIARTNVGPDVGSAAYPNNAGVASAVTSGGVLPTNGANGIVQTTNSLPRGFEDGVPDASVAIARLATGTRG